MTGQISETAARMLIREWYKSCSFNDEEVNQIIDDQIDALKKGERFELDIDLAIVIASDNKFYLRDMK